MKKVLIVIIVLLSLGVIAFGIYYASTFDFNKEPKNEKKENIELNQNSIEVLSEDSVKLISTIKKDESFIQTYQITINGKEKKLEVEFLYQDNKNLKKQSLTGNYNKVTLYAYYEKYEDEATLYDENMINSSFNENNFSFIKGIDGESYLLIYTNIYPDEMKEEDKLYILNDNFEFVANDLIDYAGNSDTLGFTIMSTYVSYKLGNEFPWYTDNFNACSTPSNCYINVKIEDNKIYYLVPVLNKFNDEEEDSKESTEKDYGNLEERVYTIRDNSLSYEVIKRYKITEVSELIK